MITYNNNDPRQTLIWSELYSAADAGGGIIADADYIIDRSINATLGEINNLLYDIAASQYDIKYTFVPSTNDFTIKLSVYVNSLLVTTLPTGCNIVYSYWLPVDNAALNSVSEFDDIPYHLENASGVQTWSTGVNKNALFEHVPSGYPDPIKVTVKLVTSDKHITLDEETIDIEQANAVRSISDDISDIQANTYTKTQVNTMLESIGAGGSSDTNLQAANLQDIQAVFNMQYQQASSEVIDPHDNP